jgi:hypothetical protein
MKSETQAAIRAHRVQTAALLDLAARHAGLVAAACAKLSRVAVQKCWEDGMYNDPELQEAIRLLSPALKAAQTLMPFPTIPGVAGDAPACVEGVGESTDGFVASPRKNVILCGCGHPGALHSGLEGCRVALSNDVSAGDCGDCPCTHFALAEHADADINLAIELATIDLEHATSIERAEFRRVIQAIITENRR